MRGEFGGQSWETLWGWGVTRFLAGLAAPQATPASLLPLGGWLRSCSSAAKPGQVPPQSLQGKGPGSDQGETWDFPKFMAKHDSSELPEFQGLPFALHSSIGPCWLLPLTGLTVWERFFYYNKNLKKKVCTPPAVANSEHRPMEQEVTPHNYNWPIEWGESVHSFNQRLIKQEVALHKFWFKNGSGTSNPGITITIHIVHTHTHI